MTHRNDYTFTIELTEKGLEAVPELLRVLIHSSMQAERAEYLQAGEYEHPEVRTSHAFGYKPVPVQTQMREITLGEQRSVADRKALLCW